MLTKVVNDSSYFCIIGGQLGKTLNIYIYIYILTNKLIKLKYNNVFMNHSWE